jgi:hypothetical protein
MYMDVRVEFIIPSHYCYILSRWKPSQYSAHHDNKMEPFFPPMSPSKLARLIKRRVPPERRQRTEMSCDYCKVKRCKCSRTGKGSCRACQELGQPCQTTRPRKQRLYPGGAALHHSPTMYPLGNEDYDLQAHGAVLLRPKVTAAEYLFEDPMGLPRYIGPTGSFTLLMRLREIMATRYTPETARLEYAQTMGQSMHLYSLTKELVYLPPRPVADVLVDVFFSNVNRDYPVFHRALFQAKYEIMWSANPDVESSWLMTLYMIFVLGMTASSADSLPPALRTQKDLLKGQFLSRAKSLLSDIISGATLGHVQALMVYCLHLHISRERNACWNIAGSAIRIAVAIGLHRNGANTKCTLLERELRKRVWWTLYSFERIECSSLGRPSAIDDTDCNVGNPAEGLLDMGDYIPLSYIDAQSRLLRMLGRICKEQSGLEQLSSKHGELARSMAEQLERWRDDLPSHLRLDAPCPPTHHRPIVLLHIQYYYTVTILIRPFLITKATAKGNRTADSPQIVCYARKCIDAGKESADLLQRLFSSGLFNAKTWWDVFFIESTSMILAMGRIVDSEELYMDIGNLLDSLKICMNILTQCGELSPTMQRFAKVTTDFAQALVFAVERQNLSSDTGSSPQDESPRPAAGPSPSLNSGQGIDLMVAERTQGLGPNDASMLDLFLDQGELADFPIPTNWDDPASWLAQ